MLEDLAELAELFVVSTHTYREVEMAPTVLALSLRELLFDTVSAYSISAHASRAIQRGW